MPNSARVRFEETRRAVARLREVQLMIMYDCEDWRPPAAAPRRALSDPTSGAAIRHVDEVDGKLAALRVEEAELTALIGEALAVIAAVRAGLGGKYADVLEWRYVDCQTWDFIKAEYDVERHTGMYRANVAFDWIDSLGITKILAGDLEI